MRLFSTPEIFILAAYGTKKWRRKTFNGEILKKYR